MDRSARGGGRRRPLTLALLAVGASMALVAAIEVVLAADTTFEPSWLIIGLPIVAVAYGVAGLVAWGRRPSNRTGPLLVLAGWTWLVAALEGTDDTVLVSVALALATLPVAVMVHILLAVPSGRLGRGLAPVVAGLAYVAGTALQVLQPLTHPSPMQVTEDPDLATAVAAVQHVAFLAVTVGLVVVGVGRLRSASRQARRVLVPLYGYGLVAIAALTLVPGVRRWIIDDVDPVGTAIVQFWLIALFPVAVAVALLLGFARAGEVDELGARLADDLDRAQLSAAVAEALGDPTVELAFWLDEPGRYVDRFGRPATVGTERRAVAPVEIGGRRVGAIVYDGSMVADAELVERAARMIALALDRERLLVEVVASRDAVRESRARMIDAADRERRRIARDLHDGLQARLVLLAMRADGLVALTGDHEEARAVRAGLEASIDELRSLVHGVLPGLLLEQGLGPAVEDLAERMPLPTAVEVSASVGRLEPTVESTGFFAVAEALTNAVKHAGAGQLWVRVRVDGDQLVIEVRDDGAGGAQLDVGRGLRGLHDRVDALGGTLELDSPAGRGTLVRATLPTRRVEVRAEAIDGSVSRPTAVPGTMVPDQAG